MSNPNNSKPDRKSKITNLKPGSSPHSVDAGRMPAQRIPVSRIPNGVNPKPTVPEPAANKP